MLVIDASCLIDLLLPNSAFPELKKAIRGKAQSIPHLADAELGQAVRNLTLAKLITGYEAT